jgi:hypothetical protein
LVAHPSQRPACHSSPHVRQPENPLDGWWHGPCSWKTMIRPFYRSRLFWLGLPGLVFLLWAWAQSNRSQTRVYLVPSILCSTQGKVFWHRLRVDHEHEAIVDYRRGKITVITVEPSGAFIIRCGFPVPRWHTVELPVKQGEQSWFPPVRWASHSINEDTGYSYASIPYWLLTGTYCLTLSAGIWWWQRRKARFIRRAAAELPGT